jgi:hypothetical protein
LGPKPVAVDDVFDSRGAQAWRHGLDYRGGALGCPPVDVCLRQIVRSCL